MKKIAVFASGGGTDFQSVIDANEREQFCKIEYLVASKPDIGAIDRANRHGINALVYDKAKYQDKDAFYADVVKTLKSAGVEYIVLAGWLLVVPASFIKEFENAIINIHPSLIPSFCGMGYYGLRVHKAAIEYGVKLSGATVHFVEADVDGGAIIMQRSVPVMADDTPESLQTRILQEEHSMLPECVKLLCEGRIEKCGRTVRIH
ncbi:MAG: phosphoribosylglycinamide formyltransferase [Clostridia bacterium]|nr:phosphoribosylglycinamide formyltransferase [Clostridia bacterium]MBQ8876440.1 phosphoribosylglycinamide formyltransferase [Clostridia bacterium]